MVLLTISTQELFLADSVLRLYSQILYSNVGSASPVWFIMSFNWLKVESCLPSMSFSWLKVESYLPSMSFSWLKVESHLPNMSFNSLKGVFKFPSMSFSWLKVESTSSACHFSWLKVESHLFNASFSWHKNQSPTLISIQLTHLGSQHPSNLSPT